jgi:hypothetical protein
MLTDVYSESVLCIFRIDSQNADRHLQTTRSQAAKDGIFMVSAMKSSNVTHYATDSGCVYSRHQQTLTREWYYDGFHLNDSGEIAYQLGSRHDACYSESNLILSRVGVTYKTSFGLDLLTLCTQHSGLQTITALSLIYTLHSSPLHKH